MSVRFGGDFHFYRAARGENIFIQLFLSNRSALTHDINKLIIYLYLVKIRSIRINNFKSLLNFELTEPNPFSVFVGANGVGKSNIFEALEYFNYKNFNKWNETDELFGGYKNFVNYNHYGDDVSIFIEPVNGIPLGIERIAYEGIEPTAGKVRESLTSMNPANPEIQFQKQFVENFTRIFINSKEGNKLNLSVSDKKLNFNADNLEFVLNRILQSGNIEIKEWLNLLRPGFSDLKIERDLSERPQLQFYEKNYTAPFGKKLISDGTFNILCLLTAIYQIKEPQFLCIEEPENGLNPYVIKELIAFFREQCKENGHYIWLNTHSQTLVNLLEPEEIIIINKKAGITTPKQMTKINLHGLPMDEAWLTNVLGGGVPW